MVGVQKRKIQWAISLLLVMLYFSGLTAKAQYGGGTGEPNDPYLIFTADQMNAIGANPHDWDKHFKLMVDIDLSGFDGEQGKPTFNTIGMSYSNAFTGVFDGNGYTISNFRLTSERERFIGLFGYFRGENAIIKDLGLIDANINAGTEDCVGSLVGYIYRGTITNCYAEGSSVSGRSSVGGLVGRNYGTITTSYGSGTVNGTGWRVGGLVGRNYGTITTSYSTGTVSGTSSVGGLAGWSYGVVNHCYSTSAVSGTRYVGGLVGNNGSSVVTGCYSIGMVSGNSNVGGIVGWGDPNSVKNSFWDVESSGLAGSAGGAGLTTAEMMDPEMLGLNGWGGDPNWVLDSGRDYPRLVWEGTPGQMIPEPVIYWLDGSGTGEDPFEIENADQLLLLHKSSLLWNKHFVLKADIDMDPNLPGRSVFAQAVIPVFWGSFVGNGHVILNLRVEGGNHLGLFGKLIEGSVVRALGLENVSVHGTGSSSYVGGLIGHNSGHVLNCYSTGAVSGGGSVGGLVGRNEGSVTECYSISVVRGTGWEVGGLVGDNNGDVTYCFWDTQTSGQNASAGGTGLTTAEMQMQSTFTDAGWDFLDETENGTGDIWWILEGQNYPKLRVLPEGLRLGPLPAFSPKPQDGATDVTPLPILYWAPADPNIRHDIYLGESKQSVVNATTLTLGIYRGRQLGDVTSYDAGILEWAKTYYWRIDEYDNDTAISKGHVWSFTTADFLVVDDFESYNDLNPTDPDSNRIFNVWMDGYGDPNNGSIVGYEIPLYVQTIVHGGKQSMPFFYSNTGGAAYSEAERTFAFVKNWTRAGVKILVLYFYGTEGNTGQLYVKVNGRKVVYDGDVADIAKPRWKQWNIDLASLGVNLQNVTKLAIGIDGTGASGTLYFDDIRLYRLAPEPAP